MKPSGFFVSIFNLKEKKKKKNIEAFRVLRDQIETWVDREFEDCNMEGSLKGETKHWSLQVLCEKTESLKATHLPTLPFRNNGYLSNFLPSYLSFHTVYKYWQNLPASVEVSLHLNSFLPHYFALWILFPLLDFVIVLCDSNYLVWL